MQPCEAVFNKKRAWKSVNRHIYPSILVYARFRAGYQIPVVIKDEILSGMEEHATKVINDARDFFEKEGIEAKTNRVEFGYVAYSIVRYSKGALDLIEMGGEERMRRIPMPLEA
jgi:hypothetical protein